MVKKRSEIEAKYQNVMRDLIKRYIISRQKDDESKSVTTDDLNEIKGDISSFRFEMLEVMRLNMTKMPFSSEVKSAC